MMDTLFVLPQESRLRILQQAAARLPGCAYLCVWAPIPGSGQPPPASSAVATRPAHRYLLCLDACLCDGGRGDERARTHLFDAYRRSLCTVVSGRVPGWAYRDGRPYLELPEHDLAASASLPVQQQFYQEAGIQMSAFMGCESGEIEVGMSTAPAIGAQINLQASVEQIFSEDFFQQSLLEELLQLSPTRPSSSSSSLPSISVGSPADGSTALLRTMALSSATPSPRELAVASPLFHHPRPPHPVPFSRHGLGHGSHVHFPSPEADDAAIAQAMLVVISSSTSPSALPTPSTPPAPGNHRAQRSPRRGTAFRAYNAALAPRAPRRPSSGAAGQRMIKMGISILRRMRMLNYNQERATSAAPQLGQDQEDATTSAPPPPPPTTTTTSSQLHHMISERRRRERLNESFEALRGLLPPGSKKDKATVLANTLEYMNILIAQVSELEAKNRTLETAAAAQSQMIHRRRHINGASPEQPLLQEAAAGPSGGGGSSEIRVQVEVTSTSGAGASSTPSLPQPPESREVTVRVAAPGADLSELVVRVLRLLKETGRFAVVAVDGARQAAADGGGVPQASLTLRATGGEVDELSLREAVTKAVEGSVTPPPPPSDHDES